MYEQVRNQLQQKLYLKFQDETSSILAVFDEVFNEYDITPKETHVVPYELNFKSLLDLYVASKAVEGYSKAGLRNYRYSIVNFFDFIHKNVEDVTTNDIRKYLYVYKENHNVSDVSLDVIRVRITAFYNWLTSEEYVTKNPCLKISKIRCEKKKRVALTTVELEELRNACENTRETALIEFLFSTGCRISEAAAMKVDDIDYHNGEVKVYNGKGKKDRITYVSSKAIIAIQDYIKYDKPDSEFLFPNRYHGQITAGALRDVVEDIAKRTTIKKPITPHVLRHTFATLGMARGMKPQSLQAAMGHESISTTMIYAEVLQEDVKMEHSKYII